MNTQTNTIDIDGEAASDGLLTLVVTVVELLVDALEREALRRMEAGSLSGEEIERLGSQLSAIEAEIEAIKRDQGIEDGVEDLRGDLDGLVSQAIEQVDEREGGPNGPGYSVFGGEER